MDEVILRVLAAEVQRRACPSCEKPLDEADVSAHFSSSDRVALHFRCRFCIFEGGGEIELTDQICEEAARKARAQARLARAGAPISADELLEVHLRLTEWRGGWQALFATGDGYPVS